MSEDTATLFCDTGMAARIERMEIDAITGGVSAGLRRGKAEFDGFAHEIAGGAACFAGPGSPLNKVVGVGFAGVPTVAQWEAVERAYAEVGAPVQVELAHLADPRIGADLTARGYRLTSFENVLGLRPRGRVWPASQSVEVRRDDEDGFDTWLDTVVDGFAHPDDNGLPAHEEFPRDILAAVIRDLAATGDTHRYLAYRDGVPAGGATLRVSDGIAALAGAATLPEHRRKGVQTALLSARLGAATAAGCDLAVVTTEPGSTSQKNSQAQGFALLYTRAVLVKDPA
ncbi:GNAT family N-acetyltransferase [Nocardia sp. PE-7]|uniref:GNAT family N-acetyltransferase n=1 Tax=Nocardia sp. PE-7 TaxID=3058426 RepID=UPI00265AB16C|nr:GNAT family N-acetyltransferase [Nocardia sp. PE-7]WKG10018.1 GNAT family N-acetyltransferase [Nocardia sp. PE-7]